MIDAAPSPPAVARTRDDVQAEMIEAILGERRKGRRSTALDACTGFGKTVVAAKLFRKLIDEEGARPLFLVDEDNLVRQAEERFASWDLRVGVEQGTRRARDAVSLFGKLDVVVATRQTLRGKRLESFPRDHINVLAIDECHVGIRGDSIPAIRDHFSDAFTLGLSATLIDARGRTLVPTYFESLAYRYTLFDREGGKIPGAITNGHLCRFKYFERESGVDLRGITTKATKNGVDYNEAELARKIDGRIGPMVNAAVEEIATLGINQAMHFAPDVQVALRIANAYTGLGIASRAIHGEMDDADAVIKAFKRNEFRVLVVVGMCLKGFDHRPLDGLIMGRPTRSEILSWQMLGRITRLSPETGKTCGHVIGYSWEADDGAGPMSTLDLFFSGLDDATREIARNMARAGRSAPVDPQEIARRAVAEKARRDKEEEELRQRRRLEAERMRTTVARKAAGGARRVFDPFAAAVTSAGPEAILPAAGGVATESQRRALAELKLPAAPGLTEAAAVRAWDFWATRMMLPKERPGSSTSEQVNRLVVFGVPQDRALAMSRAEAGAEIGRRLGEFRRWRA